VMHLLRMCRECVHLRCVPDSELERPENPLTLAFNTIGLEHFVSVSFDRGRYD